VCAERPHHRRRERRRGLGLRPSHDRVVVTFR
jgi:hypothetical protein